MTDIGRLVREANPVLDESTTLTDEELTTLLLLAESRSTDMDVKEIATPVEPDEPTRRGWLVAAASFAVILLVVGAAVVFGNAGETDTPPATDAVTPTTQAPAPTTTVPVVEESATVSPDVQSVLDAFAAAVNSGDPDAVAATLTDSFVYLDPGNEPQPLTDQGWSAEMAYLAMEGSIMTLENCTPTDTGATCEEIWDGPVLDAAYPWGWVFRDTFTIEDGLIAQINGVPISWPSDMWGVRQPIIDWVEAFDPESAAVMDVVGAAAKHEEEAALWRHYAPLWVELGRPGPGQGEFSEAMIVLRGFEAALNSGSIDHVAAFLAPDFEEEVHSDFVGTAESYLVSTNFWMEAGTLTAFTNCRPDGQRIVCTEVASGPVQDAISPWEWNTLTTIGIVDGKVAFLKLGQFAALDSVDSVQTQLSAWVQPQDAVAAGLIGESPNSTNQTAEAARAWLEWAPKWVEAGRP